MARYLESGFVPVHNRCLVNRVVRRHQQPVCQYLPSLQYGRMGLRRHVLSIPHLNIAKHIVATVIVGHQHRKKSRNEAAITTKKA